MRKKPHLITVPRQKKALKPTAAQQDLWLKYVAGNRYGEVQRRLWAGYDGLWGDEAALQICLTYGWVEMLKLLLKEVKGWTKIAQAVEFGKALGRDEMVSILQEYENSVV